MCGLCGVFNPHEPLQPPQVDACRRMSAAMLHRGPDEQGLHHEGGVALGHRRLSIIDLSTGQQPMRSADGRLTLVFNGEVYNFQDLRPELEAAGWAFRTRSDTEIIMAGYAVWGEA